MHTDLENTSTLPVGDGSDRICGQSEMADRTRAFDWAGTPLGPVSGWPESLVVLLNMLLANQHPMLLFWGDEFTQFYNDAAIPVYGPDKHPNALGQSAREGWAEVWHLVGGQLEDARRGIPIWNADTLVPVLRHGRMEDAWFTYSYSPVRDGSGNIGGVLVTCIETTGRVHAERDIRMARERLEAMFEQAPVFFAVLRGPQHVFEMANPQYLRVVGRRNILGKPAAEALPESVDQGYIAILDRVYETGEPFIGNDLEFWSSGAADHAEDVRVVDFVYQPFREADGSISGILVLGVDMSERRRATQALLSAQENRASVVESMSEGFVLISPDGRFRSFNRAGGEMYRSQGVDCNELIGRHLEEVFPDLEESPVGAALLRCLRDHEPTIAEGYFKTWNRWFQVRNYPTPDGGVANLFQDITERVQTERQLLEQRERFEFATKAAEIGYWFCDLPFDKLIWDNTVKEHFWLPPDTEIDLERFYQCLHPDDRERARHAIEAAIGNHTAYDLEYRTVSEDGRTKWIRAIGRTAYAEDGTPLRFDGVTQDVTALRHIREALDAERARLSTVFENVPIGILFTLADGRVVNANRQAERILGRPMGPGGIETYQDLTVLHANGRRVEVRERPMTLALADGGIHRAEYEYVRPDGSRIWVELIGAPILDAQGRTIGAVDAIADIDVRKRAETALVRSEKLALVGRLAASISHEINNPLEAVTNLLYLIEHNSQDSDTRQFSRMAQDELARVSHIVTHTLRFNRQSVAIGEQKISGLLESSVAIYEGRLRSSSVTLDRSYADSASVVCSGSELRQVFANLIGNSFDATKTGGRLILRTRDQRNWRTGLPGVRVTIADTGHGMSEQVRKRMFEPFFTTRGDNGTGLGLWVTREIVMKHHASMRVKSRQGKHSGTVFSIWFPRDAAVPALARRS
jgi:PAS domain S-box-containing protein